MNAKAPTRSTDNNPQNDSHALKAFPGLPTAKEQVEILEAWQDSLLRRHLGILRPEDLSDEEYRVAYAQAHEAEYGHRPLPWDEAGPEDRDADEVVETLLLHLDYTDGDVVAREWWWERFRWLKRGHPTKARAVGRALDRRRGK